MGKSNNKTKYSWKRKFTASSSSSSSSSGRKLDTKGRCFMCLSHNLLKVIKPEPETLATTATKKQKRKTKKKEEKEEESIINIEKPISLRCLSRYLQIDLDKFTKNVLQSDDEPPPLLPPPPSAPDDSTLLIEGKGGDVEVDLCNNCADLVNSFSEKFQLLERAQIEVNFSLKRIHQRISESSPEPDKTSTQLIPPLLVNQLRNEIKTKSCNPGIGYHAWVQLDKSEILVPVQLTPKVINTTVPSNPDVKPEPLSDYEAEEPEDIDSLQSPPGSSSPPSPPSSFSTAELELTMTKPKTKPTQSTVSANMGKRTIKCDFCPLYYSSIKTLKFHQKTSCKGMPKQEEEGKPKKYLRRSFKFKFLTTNNRFQCGFCPANFSSIKTLKFHQKTSCKGKGNKIKKEHILKGKFKCRKFQSRNREQPQKTSSAANLAVKAEPLSDYEDEQLQSPPETSSSSSPSPPSSPSPSSATATAAELTTMPKQEEERKPKKYLRRSFKFKLTTNNRFKCGFCLKNFSSVSTIKCHQKTSCKGEGNTVREGSSSFKIKRKKCRECKITFQTRAEQNKHYNSVHNKELCDLCGGRFNRKYFVTVHRNSCDGKLKQTPIKKINSNRETGTFSCAICSEEFPLYWIAHKHYSKVHLNLNFPCEVDGCSKSFKNKGDRGVHVKFFHLGQREGVCEFCPKTYQTRKQLNQHVLNVHHKIRHICEVCSNSFTTLDGLKRHKTVCEKMLKGEKKRAKNDPSFKFLCKLCPGTLRLSTNYHRKIHYKSHHPGEPFPSITEDRDDDEGGNVSASTSNNTNTDGRDHNAAGGGGGY